MRLDQFLVRQGFASSRTKAQEMIDRGEVAVQQGEKLLQVKASLEVDEINFKISVNSNLEKYVSRAGFKLEFALKTTNLNVKDLKVLDIGSSTGGFADCLLQAGANQIVGVDVGSGQLHHKLATDPRMINLEEINARELKSYPKFLERVPNGGFDLIVIDVSFISLDKILPSLKEFLSAEGYILALFKPQFEVGPGALNKAGIVIDQAAVQHQLKELVASLPKWGFNASMQFESGLSGRDGNQEYFLFISLA